MALEISPAEVKKQLENGALLIDVREPGERDLCCIKGSKNIPLALLADKLTKLPKGKLIITHCHHGVRSLKAAEFLQKQGFNVKSMAGGIDAWSEEVDHSVPRY